MKLPREDVLDAVLVDGVADQARRALQLGYSHEEVNAAVERGLSHGLEEFRQLNQTHNGGKLQ